MGSSDSGAGAGTGPGLTDSSVGSIVWVRRRNGSWWPGKILGPDELSSTHLMSPRSGTPVKLLGREDASVDWYNLEKSKRVKAFRCGEFDDCIEKAEASLGLPAKKREKYARREDAILHALELEKEICLKKYGKPVTNNPLVKNNSSNSAAKDLATSTRTHGTGNGKNEAYELRKLHRKNDPSAESRRICSPQKARGGGCQGLLNSEFNPPTRGLQDSGVSIYQFNQMATSSVVLNGSREMTAVEQTHTLRTSSDADSGNSSGRAKGQMDGLHGYDHVMGSSSSCFVDSLPDSILPPVKRGRMSYTPSDSGDLVEIKSGPPSQVDAFASRPMEDITHSRPNGFAEDVSYGSSEDTESDSSETDCTEQAVDVEMNTFTDANTPLDPPTRLVNRLEMHDQHESSSCEDQDQDDLSLDGTHFSYQDPISLDTGISKWQLKGRRNVRSLPRKSVNRLKSRSSYSKAGGSPLIRSTNQNLSYYHNDVDCTNDFEFVEDDLGLGRERFDERRYLPNPHFGMRRPGSMGQRMIDMEELTWGSQSMGGGNWGQMGGSFSSFFGGWHGRDKLLDVDLKVEAHHQGGERVPWVSLMSRFNGKAIVGHPIQIEKLEDGSMNSILANLGCDYNQNRVDQPLWRTARRTANFRVPHPHTSSSHPYEDDEQYLDDQDQRSVLRTSTAMTLLSGNKNAGKRKYPHVHKPSSKKKMKKKTPDRSSLSSNHKIRHLSSIGMDQSGGSDPRNRSYSHILKPLDSEPPTVACIPLKLVFSRLLEAVGRPPSGPANHGFH